MRKGHGAISPSLRPPRSGTQTGRVQRADPGNPGISDAETHHNTASQLAPARALLHAPAIPEPLTSFIGREHEVAEVRRLLGIRRLVTVTGTGGIGKTRLAMEVVRARKDVAFVDLAPHSDAHLLPAVMLTALGIHEQPRVSSLDLLTASVASSSWLLVLDNCEHLITACSELADQLLRECPQLRILATSRQPLAVAGEQVWLLQPLPVSDSTASGPAGEAERLFAERARLVQHDFALSTRNATRVTEICRQLDGIPLAIELAAARMRVLGLEGIAARLQARLRFLGTQTRGIPARQRTLQAAIEWSYDLLSEPEKAFFRSVSVCVGGWTLEAAEAIWDSADHVASYDVLDLLAALVDKSLVQVEQQPDGTVRYWLLETVREYALDRVRATAEMAAVRRRHAAYFLKFAEDAEPNLWGPTPEVWVNRLERQLDNCRAALDWLIASAHGRDALNMGVAMGPFWLLAGRYQEGQLWIGRLLELACAEDPGLVRAKLLRAQASLYAFQGDAAAAQPPAELALVFSRQYESDIDIARCLLVLGNTVQSRGDFALARHLLEEAVAVSRRAGAAVELVDGLHYLEGDAFASGDFQRAQSLADDCLISAREAGYSRGIARALWTLGSIQYFQHDLAAARLNLDESLASSLELNAFWDTVQASVWLSHVATEQGDYARSAELLTQIRELGEQLGDSEVSCLLLEGAVHLAAALNQPDRALRLAAAAESYRKAIGVVRFPVVERLVEEWLAPLRSAVGPQRTESLLQAGRKLSLEQALVEASTWGSIPSKYVSHELLTRRELEVADLIAGGRSNREIAQELVIATSTAERHVANILRKLDLQSRTQIATWMLQQVSQAGHSASPGT